MFKRCVNGFTTLIYLFHVLAITLLVVACTGSPITPASPWRVLHAIPVDGPQDQIALSIDGATAVLAWPGSLSKPDINLLNGSMGARPLRLPLGVSPRRLTLYPAPGDKLQLLWLDQTVLRETRLTGAFLDKDGAVERGPAAISNQPTGEYSAAPMPSGDLLTLWVGAGQGSTPLYAEIVDAAGRPHAPIRLAASARHPATVYAPGGALHLAWLEPGTARLWTIRYTTFPGGEPSAVAGTPVGVIQLADDEALESFGMGLDAAQVYFVWGTTRNAGQPVGRLAGLTFPIGDDKAAHPLAVVQSDQISLHWPVFQSRADKTLQIGLTMRGQGQDLPAMTPITPGGIGQAQPLHMDAAEQTVIGKTTLASDSAGNLYMAWSALRSDGSALIYCVTNRP